MDVVKNPVQEIFENWGNAMREVVGENYTMDETQTISNEKKVFARMEMLGAPGVRYDLEGNESLIMPSFQVDSYAAGQKGLSRAYEIDEASHKAMTAMRFRRTYGPQTMNNLDSNLKRVVSRYSRVYSGTL